MTKLIMGIGVPGSGKTTVLKEFANSYGYSHISPDDIRLEITGNSVDQSKNKEVWAEAYRRASDELHAGKTVVLDATFAHHAQRQEFIEFGRKNGAEKVQGIYVDTPIEIAKERNRARERVVPEYVVDRMDKSLRDFPPEVDDGFDSLFTLDEAKRLTDAEVELHGEVIHKEFDKLL